MLAAVSVADSAAVLVVAWVADSVDVSVVE